MKIQWKYNYLRIKWWVPRQYLPSFTTQRPKITIKFVTNQPGFSSTECSHPRGLINWTTSPVLGEAVVVTLEYLLTSLLLCHLPPSSRPGNWETLAFCSTKTGLEVRSGLVVSLVCFPPGLAWPGLTPPWHNNQPNISWQFGQFPRWWSWATSCLDGKKNSVLWKNNFRVNCSLKLSDLEILL